MAAIDKVKVLIVGDSGVGKSCLTHLISQGEPISNPTWTVGCSVEVKLHEFREGTLHQKTYFIELWDIGGSSNHRNTRSVFYNCVHGIIFTHDLTNRKSQINLKYWLAEVFNKEDGKGKQMYEDFDKEQFAGSSMIPMIFIGTKLDLAEAKRLNGVDRAGDIAQDWGADKIYLDCRDGRSLSPGNSASVKLSRFFDKVIEMRYHRHDLMSPVSVDKRRSFPVSPGHDDSGRRKIPRSLPIPIPKTPYKRPCKKIVIEESESETDSSDSSDSSESSDYSESIDSAKVKKFLENVIARKYQYCHAIVPKKR